MSGRMNWDRVRKESLSHLHGSEWVKPSDDTLLGIGWKENDKKKVTRKKNKRKKIKSGLTRTITQSRSVVPLTARMVGCTCGKSTGFTGQHKKSCPLRKPETSTQAGAKGKWVCPQCFATLAGAKVPQSVALEILRRHQQTSHNRTSRQSTSRPVIPPASTRTPVPILSSPDSGADKRHTTLSESKHADAQILIALPHKLPAEAAER